MTASRCEVYAAAADDARTLADGGVDGIIVENAGDLPFARPESIAAETVAGLTAACLEVRAPTRASPPAPARPGGTSAAGGGTRFGLRVFAVGSSAEAARRAGIDVKAYLVAIYMISGTLAGLAAVMSNARFSTTTIGGHAMDNLSTISAVVLGGTSLFGSIAGTVVGVFIPIILLNGFVILGIPPFWQTVAMGAVLILAVWIDQLKRRARERG